MIRVDIIRMVQTTHSCVKRHRYQRKGTFLKKATPEILFHILIKYDKKEQRIKRNSQVIKKNEVKIWQILKKFLAPKVKFL